MRELHDSKTRTRQERLVHAARTAVEVGITVVVVLDAVDQLRTLRRGLDRAVSAWWTGVDRHVKRQVHEAELIGLAKALRQLDQSGTSPKQRTA